MNPTPRRPTHWLDQPKNVKTLWRSFIVVLALTILAEFLIPLHPTFPIESLFGFSAAFGFIACAFMIIGAKLLGFLIKRPDDYYTKKDDVDE